MPPHTFCCFMSGFRTASPATAGVRCMVVVWGTACGKQGRATSHNPPTRDPDFRDSPSLCRPSPRSNLPTMRRISVFRFDRGSGEWVEAGPTADHSPARPRTPATLRVATFNVLADCFPCVVEIAINSPARYAALPMELARIDADVVGLNEMTVRWLRALLRSDYIRTQYYVTEAVDGARTRNGTLDRRMGNVILSRVPITAAYAYAWSTPATAMDRDCVLACVRAGGPPLTVISAHTLAYSKNDGVRRAQLVEVSRAARVLDADAALLLMGDLNLHEPHEDGVVAACGLVDVWADSHFGTAPPFNDGDPGFTFDVRSNTLIPRYIPPETRRMRLDRVLLSPGSPWGPASPARLFANTPVSPHDYLFLSDHYGIVTDLVAGDRLYVGDGTAAGVLARNGAGARGKPYTIPPTRALWTFALHTLWLLYVLVTRPLYFLLACVRPRM